MADKTIDQLDPGGAAEASDTLPIERAGLNYFLTISAIAAFVNANLTAVQTIASTSTDIEVDNSDPLNPKLTANSGHGASQLVKTDATLADGLGVLTNYYAGKMSSTDPTTSSLAILEVIFQNLFNSIQNISNGTSWVTCAAQAIGNVNISNPGTAVFDGVTLTSGTDYLFLSSQTNAAENGPYLFNGSSSALTRASAANTWQEITTCNIVINDGTTYAGYRYYNTNSAGGTLGTTPVTYAVWNTAYVAGTNIYINGNTINVANIPSKTIPANLTGSAGASTPSTLPQIFNAMTPTGNTWYVDQVNGSDSNTGTNQVNAFISLTKAQSSAASGDVIRILGNYGQSALFTISKNLVFVADEVILLSGGVTFSTNANTVWRGTYSFFSTNIPALTFNNGGVHRFDEISASSTYNSSAIQTIASAILNNSGASIFIKKINSLGVTTSSTPAALIRAANIYTTGSGTFNLTIDNGMYNLNRSQNGVQYNIFYTDVNNVYCRAIFNNSKILEYNGGQSDATINDLFIGSNGFQHVIEASNVYYQSQNFRIAGPKIRLANCDNGENRNCISLDNVTVDPAYLSNGDILLSNSTSSGDCCVVTDCKILQPGFQLAVSGAGTNVYTYYNKGGDFYTSNIAPLPSVPSNNLLANLTASTAPPTGKTLSAILDAIFGSTQGQILTRGASSWTALTMGSNGQYLGVTSGNLGYSAPPTYTPPSIAAASVMGNNNLNTSQPATPIAISHLFDGLGKTLGGIVYRDTDANGWVFLPAGTVGQVLKISSSGVPVWQNP